MQMNKDILQLKNGDLILTINESDSTELLIAFKGCSPYEIADNKLAYEYDTSATCPFWLALLDDYFDKDRTCIKLLQQFFGICLTDWRHYECFLILYGVWRSGKGVIAETLQKLTKSTTCKPELLDKLDVLGRISPYKMVFMDEADKVANGQSFTDTLKRLTTTGLICTSRQGSTSLFDSPVFPKIVLSFNAIPETLVADHALAARMRALYFRKTFAGEEDSTIKTIRLPRELPGILNWALEGLREAVKDGRVVHNTEHEQVILEEMGDPTSFVFEFIQNLNHRNEYKAMEMMNKFNVTYHNKCVPLNHVTGGYYWKRFMRQISNGSTLRYKRSTQKEHRYLAEKGIKSGAQSIT